MGYKTDEREIFWDEPAPLAWPTFPEAVPEPEPVQVPESEPELVPVPLD